MRRPSATKALKLGSLMITIWMFCFSSPAARRIGRVYSRSSASDSVSRRIGGPLFSCAATGENEARTKAAATRAAIGPDNLLRSTIRSNISERSLQLARGSIRAIAHQSAEYGQSGAHKAAPDREANPDIRAN